MTYSAAPLKFNRKKHTMPHEKLSESASAVSVEADADKIAFVLQDKGRLHARVSDGALVAEYMFVEPQERRKGHGLALAERAIRYAEENGLHCATDNVVMFDHHHLAAGLARRGYAVSRTLLPIDGEPAIEVHLPGVATPAWLERE